MTTTESITISAETIAKLVRVHDEAQKMRVFWVSKGNTAKADLYESKLGGIEHILNIIGIEWTSEESEEPKQEEQKPEKVEEPKAVEYPKDDRMFQLQMESTRYYDGSKGTYTNGNGNNRNYKTLKSAIRSAKKELKRNSLQKVVRCEEEVRGPRPCDIKHHYFAEDGHEFTSEEYGTYGFWHVDGVRIVDRITQKVIWEERAI